MGSEGEIEREKKQNRNTNGLKWNYASFFSNFPVLASSHCCFRFTFLCCPHICKSANFFNGISEHSPHCFWRKIKIHCFGTQNQISCLWDSKASFPALVLKNHARFDLIFRCHGLGGVKYYFCFMNQNQNVLLF